MKVLAVLLLASFTGCTGPRCERVEQRATDAVLDVVEQDQSCSTDADCVVVPINGSCFDVCTRVVASNNEASVLDAIDDANTDICSNYVGCRLISPPCAAPAAPRCNDDGQCE